MNGQERPKAGDKAGSSYWNSTWSSAVTPVSVDPRASGLNNYVYRRFHQRLKKALAGERCGEMLLEIGCGGSAWLPYFAREYGFRVSGVDYSAKGCDLARSALRLEGYEGNIVCADFFDAPKELFGTSDVVFSNGVVEHFGDTDACILALERFLKPGGLMVTIIPNMRGFPGILQRLVDRSVYDIHVPLDVGALEKAHQKAGLEDVRGEYFLLVNLNVVNAEKRSGTVFYHVFVRARSWTSKLIWMIEPWLPLISPNRVISPYIFCSGRKPCA